MQRHGRLAACLLLLSASLAASPSSPVAEPPKPTDQFAESWRWVHFTTASGLPSDTVSTAVDLPGDSLWALSRGTVSRFDGYRWRPVDLPELRQQVVQIGLAASRQMGVLTARNLWVGDGHGLQRTAAAPLSPSTEFTGLARATRGPLLLLTSDYRLQEWDGQTSRRHTAAEAFGPVLKLFQAGAGVWLSTHAGLFSWNGERWTRRLAATTAPLGLLAAFQNEDGSAWAYVERPGTAQGLYHWSANGTLGPVMTAVESPIISLAQGPDGTLLAAHITGEVTERVGNRWRGVVFGRRMINDGRTVGFRANGDAWAATDQGLLLHRLASQRWRWDSFPPPDDRNAINDMVRAPDGTIWLATGAGLVKRSANGTKEFISHLGTEPARSLTGIALDDDNRLWVSSGYGIAGVRYLDSTGWHAFNGDPRLSRSAVHRIVRDRDGSLWFLGIANDPDREMGAAEAPGAFRLGRDGRVTRFGPEEGLPSGRVYSMATAPDGAHWFGTMLGLSRWYKGNWQHWGTKDGLRSSRVFTLAVDADGVVWFGHQALGLGRLQNGRVDYLSVGDGLATDMIWNVVPDPAKGRLWVAGQGGLSLLEGGTWTAFDERHGLPNTRLWALVPDGDLLHIGCNGGGYVELSLKDPAPPPLVVSEPPAIDTGGVLLRWTAYPWWGEVATEDVPTRVRIDDGPWTTWGTERSLRVANMASGTHKVWIEAKGLLGEIGRLSQPVLVTIEPPLWLRPVFYVPIATLGIAVVGLLALTWTRQRRHHAEVTAREAWFNKAFEASPLPAAIITLDDGRIVAANSQFVKETEYSREELLGKTVTEAGVILEGHDAELVGRLLREKGAVRDLPLRSRSRSGQLKQILAYLEVIDLNGQPSVLGQFLDQTEQQRLQVQLQQAQRLESIGRLAGGVAHDFNNLLTVVLGNAALLDASLPEGDPRRSDLEQISIAGERAERLTRQLLAFARKQAVEPRQLHVNDVVLRTDKMLRRLIGEDVELVTLMGPDVAQVFIDPGQLEQVLLNMAVNARDAMPRGGTLTISTSNIVIEESEARLEPGLSAGPFVRLSIADTGHGMPAYVAEQVFEPFFTTKEAGKGTGLGLATCYGIVKQAGGRIVVDTAEGRGTTFHVDLPRSERPTAPVEGPDTGRETPGGQETILLVEDEVQVRRLAAAVLRRRGYDVIEAASGPEALALATSFRSTIDLVVTDVVMPQMRGTELSRRIRALRPYIKVLYVSGYTDHDLFKQEAGYEAPHFLPKPFTPAQLSLRVREVLDEASGSETRR